LLLHLIWHEWCCGYVVCGGCGKTGLKHCTLVGGITLSVKPVNVDSGDITLYVQSITVDCGGVTLSVEPVSVDSCDITPSGQPFGID